MKQTISLEKLLNKARKYCYRSEKCSFDVLNILFRWRATSAQSEKIVQLLIDENLVNDLRYAKLYVMGKFKLNKWGRLKIIHYLKNKKIKDTYISQSIAQINEEEYLQLLREILDKKRVTLQCNSEYELKSKLFQFAFSKGFEKNIIMQKL